MNPNPPKEASQRVIHLPEKAVIPSDWDVQKDLFEKGMIIHLRGKKRAPTIHLDLDTRNLSCGCKSFKKNGSCLHLLDLISKSTALPEAPTDTKIASYYKFTGNEISDRQLAVLNCLKKHGPACNRMIAKRMRKPVNCITGRCFELRAMRLVRELGRSYDFRTKRWVEIWQAVPWGEDNGN
jgi:hypothetical protein